MFIQNSIFFEYNIQFLKDNQYEIFYIYFALKINLVFQEKNSSLCIRSNLIKY